MLDVLERAKVRVTNRQHLVKLCHNKSTIRKTVNTHTLPVSRDRHAAERGGPLSYIGATKVSKGVLCSKLKNTKLKVKAG